MNIKLKGRLADNILSLFIKNNATTEVESNFLNKSELDLEFLKLCEIFSDFKIKIKDKEILDFGCGFGHQSIALAMNGAKHVVGLDIIQKRINKARELAQRYSVNNLVSFTDQIEPDFRKKFDIIISKDSFEHFSDPLGTLQTMLSILKNEGILLIAFGPPWFSPYGSHIGYTKIPWVNILFDESAVMKFRNRFRNDGASRYEEVEGGLNKMSIKKFEKCVLSVGLKIEFKLYHCIKGLDFLGNIPFIRELFINQVVCELSNK